MTLPFRVLTVLMLLIRPQDPPVLDMAPTKLRLQRSHGRATVTLGVQNGRSRLRALRQEGCAKAFLPSVHDAVPEVVFLNTAGGITGGDRLRYELTLGEGARAVATTQAAERVYASAGGSALASVALQAARGASLDWLPQETIVFDGAALERSTTVELAAEAQCLLAETLVLGRAAMGEIVSRLSLRDVRIVNREGVPVLIDPLALDEGALADRRRPALLGEARAVAIVALVAPGAEAAADAVRRLPAGGLEVAVSGWDGRCLVRVLGRDGWPVSRYVARVLSALRPGRSLPRVWQS